MSKLEIFNSSMTNKFLEGKRKEKKNEALGTCLLIIIIIIDVKAWNFQDYKSLSFIQSINQILFKFKIKIEIKKYYLIKTINLLKINSSSYHNHKIGDLETLKVKNIGWSCRILY